MRGTPFYYTLLSKVHFELKNWHLYKKGAFCLRVVLRKSQGNSPRFAGSTKLRTVSFHVPLFYDPMYNLSIFYHLSILQSNSQSFHNLSLFTISSNHHLLHLQNCFYLSTLFGSTHPLRVSEISSELVLYITSPLYLFSLRLMQLNVCHILTRIIKVFTHVPAIPARLF